MMQLHPEGRPMAKGENPSTADSSGMNIPISSLHRFCIDAMVKSGLGSDDAKTVADVLTTNDAWGIYSHGTLSLRQYLKRVRGGGINARAQPLVMKEGPGWALVDADNALGMISSCHAMQTAMTKAGSQGIGYVGVRNSFHFGAAGYYANLATGKDMIGIAMSNTNANMAATGSSARVLGNNPIAYAVPAGEEKCIVLDIATSAAAGRKIAAAKSAGQKIPEGWLMDDEGMPSTRS
jgi:ureidoglycolate dehydrogenase (NAD+)